MLAYGYYKKGNLEDVKTGGGRPEEEKIVSMANYSRNDFSLSKSFFSSIDRNYPTVMDSMYELDESDVWNSPESASPPCRISSSTNTASPTTMRRRSTAISAPVDVPDWSKILKDGKERASARNGEEEEDGEGGEGVPPHVMAAAARELGKSSGVAYSVCEGVGRTLKGRDLSKVRNAIWEITGFQG